MKNWKKTKMKKKEYIKQIKKVIKRYELDVKKQEKKSKK